MTDAADRSSVTLDRREKQNRRSDKNRRREERRGGERRVGEDRRQQQIATDHDDRSQANRRSTEDRRLDSRRKETRRQGDRLTGEETIETITDEEFSAFESPPLSKTRLLAQILIVIGTLILLKQV